MREYLKKTESNDIIIMYNFDTMEKLLFMSEIATP